MSFIYAELNSENICTGVSFLSGECKENYMIPIEMEDISLIGKRYNNGIWEEVEQQKQEPSSEVYKKYYETVNPVVLGGET